MEHVEQQADDRQRPHPNAGHHREQLRAEHEGVEDEGVIANRVPGQLHEPGRGGQRIVAAIEPDDDCGLGWIARQPRPRCRTAGLKFRDP